MAQVIHAILVTLQIIIFVDVILSWVRTDPYAFPRNFTRQITEPLYTPIRAILDPQKMGGLDLSPMIIIILLNSLSGWLRGAL